MLLLIVLVEFRFLLFLIGEYFSDGLSLDLVTLDTLKGWRLLANLIEMLQLSQILLMVLELLALEAERAWSDVLCGLFYL